MNTIFMNSENSETSAPHRLLVTLTDKTDLRRADKYIVLSIHGMKNLNYLMHQILYQILKIIWNVY